MWSCAVAWHMTRSHRDTAWAVSPILWETFRLSEPFMQLLQQAMDPKSSKWYCSEVSWAKTLTVWQLEVLSCCSLSTALSHLLFLPSLEADFPATLEIKSTVWWASTTYSLELRRIIALTHRYSLCCSFSSRNLEVMARSISKISKIPSTHFPSSLWKHIEKVTEKVELRNSDSARQKSKHEWGCKRPVHLFLGRIQKVLLWNLNWKLHWNRRSSPLRNWFSL